MLYILFYNLCLIFLNSKGFFKVLFCYLLFLLALANGILFLCMFSDFYTTELIILGVLPVENL